MAYVAAESAFTWRLGEILIMREALDGIEFKGDDKTSRRPNPIDVHVGGRVRLRRMLLGLSQEKLGEQLGLTFQQIQKYEKGVNRIGASRLYDLSRILGVGVDFFFDDLEETDPRDASEAMGCAIFADADDSVVEFLKSREAIELNRSFSRINDPRVRRSVLELVRNLSEDRSFAT